VVRCGQGEMLLGIVLARGCHLQVMMMIIIIITIIVVAVINFIIIITINGCG
jgi:hypothetical protein